MTHLPRPEYPRPRLVRDRWTSLNGTWSFAFDDGDRGLADRWYDRGDELDRTIEVPFAPQAKLSGIGDRGRHDVAWYARTLDRPADAAPDDEVLLHFGAVDHHATVWLDGRLLGEHEGGNLPFSFAVGDALTGAGHRLVLRAYDPLPDVELARGKQHWRTESKGIFYTATTGIWQPVWLEPVPRKRITDVACVPDVTAGTLTLEIGLAGRTDGLAVRTAVSLAGEDLDEVTVRVTPDRTTAVVVLPLALRHAEQRADHLIDGGGVALWSPERPRLYDLTVSLIDGSDRDEVVDRVETYAGMRSVDVRDGRLCLNGRPYVQRLVLDQGYWPEGLMTAPTDDDLRADIEHAKALGFNGARKHQKVEDPRWLYWADRLGFLVWDELPSAYRYSTRAAAAHVALLTGLIERDRSHPCVVAWTPVNESWGVPALGTDARQRAFLDTLHGLAHALDGTRPVISNDGWQHARTDLVTLHDYREGEAYESAYRSLDRILGDMPSDRPPFVPGYAYEGQPILVTEFGGLAIEGSDVAGSWGYHTTSDAADFVTRYRALVRTLHDSPYVQGFCWTQLTDVEQETNGLLTYDRRFKADPEVIRAITEGRDRG